MHAASTRRSDLRHRISRPARLAVALTGDAEDSVADSFFDGVVLLGITPELERSDDAHLTLLTLCNHVLRFCPTVIISASDLELIEECREIAASIHGTAEGVQRVTPDTPCRPVDVAVMVSTTDPGDGSVVVNSTGWVARISSEGHAPQAVAWSARRPNAIGAMAAACLGSAEAFLRLIGYTAPARRHEISLLTGEVGPIGTLDDGPDLPDAPLVIDGLLVGCGAVGNGWAATVRRLPITGGLRVVDRQTLGSENIGPYALATESDIGAWKVDTIRRSLAPTISVQPFHEELDLFVPRMVTYGNFPLPALVVSGLDAAIPRHTLQRLWPATLIDLAAGGATAQVHLHRAGQGGQCLLGVHTVPPDALTYAERISAETGLRSERILADYNRPISEDDVASAPSRFRTSLEQARRADQLICSRITQANLEAVGDDDGFAPAAPFVAGVAGAMGASLTVQVLMRRPPESGWHWQYSFSSGRSLVLPMQGATTCECRRVERHGVASLPLGPQTP